MTTEIKRSDDNVHIPPAEDFPYAPRGWSPEQAAALAVSDSLELTADHWLMLAALQEYFVRNSGRSIRLRSLHDALKEKFHAKGGGRYLYHLFPGGPVAQGCQLAGLDIPAGSVDRSYGSVS